MVCRLNAHVYGTDYRISPVSVIELSSMLDGKQARLSNIGKSRAYDDGGHHQVECFGGILTGSTMESVFHRESTSLTRCQEFVAN
jgi:hypothetical protein